MSTDPDLILSGARAATGFTIIFGSLAAFSTCAYKAMSHAYSGEPGERRSFYYPGGAIVGALVGGIFGTLVMSGLL